MLAIHAYMTQGPEASGHVRAALDEQFGEELGGMAHHMLIGYTSGRDRPSPTSTPAWWASSRRTRIRRVSSASASWPSSTLKRLTGRDDLGYDPDHPDGKGFDAWNDLLRRNELRPPAPRPAAKTKSAR